MMKRQKRIFCCVLFAALVPLLFGFRDLPDEQWASAVEKLAEEGTVTGYEDGSFQPFAQVTRAEFVKMAGVRDSLRSDIPGDLKARHWSVGVLMHSSLRLIDGNIFPDEPITRRQAVQYLYDCYAEGASNDAPSMITNAAEDSAAEVGWAYEHGILTCDDGITLRLDDTVTRAEAAEMIVKARDFRNEAVDFAELVPDSVLQRVYNGSFLFDSSYKADAVLTNGEVARAARRLQLDRVDGLFYSAQADFEHEYANDLKEFEMLYGEGRISAQFADAPAMPEDTLSVMAFAMAAKIHGHVSYGLTDAYYRDTAWSNPGQNAPLTFLYVNGIRFYSGGRLGSGAPVTCRTMAALLLQMDQLWGLHSSALVDMDGITYQDEPMRFTDLPQQADLFPGILKSVPNNVYDAPVAFAFAPTHAYSFTVYCRDAYEDILQEEARKIFEKCGVKVVFTFYPELVYDNGEGFVMRARAKVAETGEKQVTLHEIFPDIGSEILIAKPGMVLWKEYALPHLFMLDNSAVFYVG